MITCAAVQTNPVLADRRANLTMSLHLIEECASNGARLIVFPECSLTGYCFDGRGEAESVAEEIPGPSTEVLAAKARETNTYIVAGLLEREDDRLYNAAVLIGPEGAVRHSYRKTHLPGLGVDRFADPGEGPLEVVETDIGRVGILICYDLFFPEPARALMLKGMDLLLLPTNWPVGREANPDFVVKCRARENHVYVAATNRAGEERGTRFFGRSQICDPEGRVLGEAAPDAPDVLYAEIDPRSSREHHVVLRPGEFEPDLMKDRRPELYGALTEELGVEAPARPGSGG
ncbi:MAG: carbon-nitrogen hydrolase family protein [Nitrospinota bacterium]